MSENPNPIRASNADRDHVADILRRAAGDGLLTLDEADERLAAVYAARYRHELAPLTADLPTPAAQPHPSRRPWLPPIRVIALVAVLVAALGAAAHGHFFFPGPLVILLIFALFRFYLPRTR